MSPETLRTAGRLLYGDRYAIELGLALGVADRTVRRWAAGTAPIPPGIVTEILALLATRRTEIAAIEARIQIEAQDASETAP